MHIRGTHCVHVKSRNLVEMSGQASRDARMWSVVFSFAISLDAGLRGPLIPQLCAQVYAPYICSFLYVYIYLSIYIYICRYIRSKKKGKTYEPASDSLAGGATAGGSVAPPARDRPTGDGPFSPATPTNRLRALSPFGINQRLRALLPGIDPQVLSLFQNPLTGFYVFFGPANTG